MRSANYLLARNRRFAANLQKQIDQIKGQALSFEKRLDLYQSKIDDLIGTSGVAEVELAGLNVSVDQCKASDEVYNRFELTFDALIAEMETGNPSEAEFDQYMRAVETSNTQIRKLLGQLESTRVLVAALNVKTMTAYSLLSTKLGIMSAWGWKMHLDLRTLLQSLSTFLQKITVGIKRSEEKALLLNNTSEAPI